MMSIYKYTSKRHADGLAKEGRFRIGTLHEYRNLEHTIGVADPNEGTKRVRGTLTEHFRSSDDIPSSFLQLAGMDIRDSTDITFSDVSFNTTVSSADAYIWCASVEKSITVQEQFGNADSCVEIFDLDAFFDVLSKFMKREYGAQFMGLYEVTYRERVEEWHREHLGIHPGLIKEPSFSAQKEIRAIWQQPEDTKISPVIGQLPSLTEYCRLVNLIA